MIEVIAFDADDTLWHTENLFQDVQARLAQILDHYAPHSEVEARLQATERRNIQLFGYGIKGFTLSMVETAIEISQQRISARDIHEIVMLGKAMFDSPLELFAGIEEVLRGLGQNHRLLLITKGDLLDQRNKIDKSGLAPLFEQIEIVPEKDPASYREIFARHGIAAATAMMVGNSLRSDVLPVLEIGGHAVHVPYVVTAAFERHDGELDHHRFHELARITELPELLARL